MKNLNIDGLSFELFLSFDQISNKIIDLSRQLKKAYSEDFPLCLIVLNGASVFANELLKQLDSSTEFSLVKVKSYNGMQNEDQVSVEYLPLDLVKNRKVLLIEDIVDTGNTLSFLRNELKKNGVIQIDCVTLLFKPKKYNYDLLPEYIGFNIGEEFVVGFGMDLNQKGRELKNIYKNIIYQN